MVASEQKLNVRASTTRHGANEDYNRSAALLESEIPDWRVTLAKWCRSQARVPICADEEVVVAEFELRDLHLVKKSLAIAVLAIERQPGEFQSLSDQTDMKTLLERLIPSDTELAHYLRGARLAVTGKPD